MAADISSAAESSIAVESSSAVGGSVAAQSSVVAQRSVAAESGVVAERSGAFESRVVAESDVASSSGIVDRAFLEEMLQCSLCHERMKFPASLTCGHSFCRACLRVALGHRKECPMCRAPCYTVKNPRPNIALMTIMLEAFPEDAEALLKAKAEMEAKGEEDTQERVLPLFLSSAVQLPGSNCSMNLFEPRYRLLTQRALDSGGDFAMVWARAGVGFPLMVEPASLVGTFACIVHITRSRRESNGTWNLACRGVAKAEIKECWVEAQSGHLFYVRLRLLPEDTLSPMRAASPSEGAEPVAAVAAETTAATATPVVSLADGSEPFAAAAVAPAASPLEGSELELAGAVAPAALPVPAASAAPAAPVAARGPTGSRPNVEYRVPATMPRTREEQLAFLRNSMRDFGVLAEMLGPLNSRVLEGPLEDVSRMSDASLAWEAASALGGPPYGWATNDDLQGILDAPSLDDRISRILALYYEVKRRRWSLWELFIIICHRWGPLIIALFVAWGAATVHRLTGTTNSTGENITGNASCNEIGNLTGNLTGNLSGL